MSDESTIRIDRNDRITRQMTTILVGDIAGYANLMGIDETNTHQRVLYVQDQVVEPAIHQHGGRLVKTTGDSFLAMFEVPVEAVRCAIGIQQRMDEENKELPKANSIRFRLGLNFGSVIVERHEMYGDGINVAGRLQQIAEPGSIYISHALYEQVHQKLVARYQPLGDKTLKNIDKPVTTYRVMPLSSGVARVHGKNFGMALAGCAAATIALMIAGGAWQMWPTSKTEEPQLANLSLPPLPKMEPPKMAPSIPAPAPAPAPKPAPQQANVPPPSSLPPPVQPLPRPVEASPPPQATPAPPPPSVSAPPAPSAQPPVVVRPIPPEPAQQQAMNTPARPPPQTTITQTGNMVLKPPPNAGPPANAGPPQTAETAQPDMVSIPGGSFMMGSTEDASEQPVHRVTIQSFQMGRYPVTTGEWRECVQQNGCEYRPKPSLPNEAPMTNVSWSDAQQYVNWLSMRTGGKYRLPSEAEWEYAVRGNTTTRYWWGNVMAAGYASCSGCGDTKQPMRVGIYPRNPFGLYDMGTGVTEWVADCWVSNYRDAPQDGSPRMAPNCKDRVLRGGAWNTDSSYVRSSSRNFYDDGVRYLTHGFRLARSQ